MHGLLCVALGCYDWLRVTQVIPMSCDHEKLSFYQKQGKIRLDFNEAFLMLKKQPTLKR